MLNLKELLTSINSNESPEQLISSLAQVLENLPDKENEDCQILSLPEYINRLHAIEEKAVNFYDNGNYQLALKYYVEVDDRFAKMDTKVRNSINWDEKKASLEVQIGRCYNHLGNKDKAIAFFNSALTKEKRRLDILLDLAKAHFNAGELAVAKKYVDLCLSADPEVYKNLNLTGNLSYEAIKSDCYLVIAEIAFQSQDLEKAAEYYLKGEDYLKLAQIYFLQKDYGKTIATVKKVSTSNKKDVLRAEWKMLFWGISLYNLIDQTFNITDQDKQQLNFALQLLQKASESKDPTIIFAIAFFYDEDIAEKDRDVEKMLKLYRRAAELNSKNAMQNLAFKYEFGEDVEADPKKAVEYYLAGAKLGFVDSKSDLGRCYLQGVGCEVDLIQAKFWLEQAVEENLLAKHYLAAVLFFEYEVNRDPELGKRIVQLLQDAAKTSSYALYNLGAFHQHGVIVDKNLQLAEFYYIKASDLGVREASNNLLIMYVKDLMNWELNDPKYLERQKSCYRLLEKNYGVSEKILKGYKLVELLNKFKIIEQKFCFIVNKSIVNIDKEQVIPERKIGLILNSFDKKIEMVNSVNLATALSKISTLLDKVTSGQMIFKKYKNEIITIIVQCTKKLKLTDFSLWCICNLITGVSKLYRHGYDLAMDLCLKELYLKLIAKQDEIVLQTVQAVLPAATRVPLKSNFISSELQTFINIINKKSDIFFTADAELSLVGYSMAMLDNYRRIHPEFKVHIEEKLLEKMFNYNYTAIKNNSLFIENRHQSYLAAIYFTNHYPTFSEKYNFGEESYIKLFQKLAENTKNSNLQQKIFSYISKYTTCKSEFIINSLPVDIVHKNYLIHVNGPYHYIFIDDANYQPSAKEYFHATLLSCRLTYNQEAPKYINIYLDYQQYNLLGNQYVNNALAENGLHLSSYQNRYKGEKKYVHKNKISGNEDDGSNQVVNMKSIL